ncbi:unnamed protein product [Meloidogyne enterolobii]|uniref:Uncharacterized protein n=1 Tax=Meloidogyne enterolobii TaxID=390850 RepID=A0ACB0YLD4_MELEN
MKMDRKLSTISIANSLDDIESCTNSECLTFRDEMIKRLTAMDENLKKNADKYDSLCTIVMELQLKVTNVYQQIGEIHQSGKQQEADSTMEQLKKLVERNIPPQPITVSLKEK